MSKHASLPDGTLLEFPDDTPDDVMDKVVKQHLGVSDSHGASGSWTDPSIDEKVDKFQKNHPTIAAPVNAVMGFGKGVYDAASGMVSSVYHAATDPNTDKDKVGGVSMPLVPTMAKRLLFDPQAEQLKKAKYARANGQNSEAAGHAVAAALPVIGPAAASIGERAGTGDIMGALGQGAAMAILPKAIEELTGAAGSTTSPENLQDLATRARMIRDNGPSTTHGAIGAAAGGSIGYKMGGAPGAVAGGAIGGAVGRSGVGMAAGGAASVLDKLAKIREGMGAPARTATYAPPATLPYGNDVSMPAIEQPQTGATYWPPEDAQLLASRQARQNLANRPAEAPPAAPPNDAHAMAIQQAQQNLTNRPAEAPSAPMQAAEPAMEHPIQQISPEVATTVDALITRGKGPSAAPLAVKNAPYLLDLMPELKGVGAGPKFDSMLYNKFQQVGHELSAKMDSIPGDRPVATSEAGSKLTEIADKAAAGYQGTEANAIKKLADLLDSSGTTPWEQIVKIKRNMFDKLDITSGPGGEAYQVFKDLTEKVNPDLADLNRKYFTLRTATELANMDPGGITPEGSPRPGGGTRPKAEAAERLKAAKEARTPKDPVGIQASPARRMKGGPL